MDPYLYVIPWTGAAVILGYVGMNTKAGFWLTFLASMLLSPMAGVILLLIVAPKKQGNNSSSDPQPPTA